MVKSIAEFGFSVVLFFFFVHILSGDDFFLTLTKFEFLELLRLKDVNDYFFFFFGLNKQPTNMCKINILVHLKYKWLNLF